MAEPPTCWTASSRQLVALRDEVQGSGRLTARLRRVGAVAGAVGAPLLLLLGLAMIGTGWVAGWEVLAVLGTMGLAVGLGVGVPVSLALLRERRSQLRRQLIGLSPEQKLAVLVPLHEARGDTRRIVAPLLRELRAGTELTPAPAPGGRGDEPAAAG
jgi:hypothetical protein